MARGGHTEVVTLVVAGEGGPCPRGAAMFSPTPLPHEGPPARQRTSYPPTPNLGYHPYPTPHVSQVQPGGRVG
eukprot:2613034-Prymnesium_polylepis.1